MIIETKHYIAGHEVRPGARIPYPTNLERSRISVVTVCDGVKPNEWHGEVVLFGRVILVTDKFGTDSAAGRAAEELFVDKVTALFAS